MEHVWTRVVDWLLAGDLNWGTLFAVFVVGVAWAGVRMVSKAKKFRLVIEYIAGDK